MASSAFPGRPFALENDAALVQQDISGNRSQFTAWLRISKLGYSPTFSNSPISSWNVTVNGASVGAASGLTFDFTGAGPWYLWQGTFWVNHNPDGTFPASAMAGFASYDQLGYAEVWQALSAPRIARGPRVGYGGVWRNSVAYVGYGGVWRLAIPYVGYGGTWRVGGS